MTQLTGAAGGGIRRGLVLSGGAALGAYQAGVLRALHEAGLEFEVISATSIGTINAAAWNIPSVIPVLHEHWDDNIRRLRPFDPGQVLRARNPFRFHRALDTLTDTYRALYPFDNERAEILVTVTDLADHSLQVVSTSDTRLPEADRELFLKASTAILHIGSAAIEVQGRRYYDGGYYNNIPLEPLLEKDLDEIWVIPLSPIRDPALPLAAKQRRLLNWANAKRALPHALTYSLLSFMEQQANPPCMQRGAARKIIISPFLGGHMSARTLGESLLFAPASIRRLIDAGYVDGRQQVERYLAPSTSQIESPL